MQCFNFKSAVFPEISFDEKSITNHQTPTQFDTTYLAHTTEFGWAEEHFFIDHSVHISHLFVFVCQCFKCCIALVHKQIMCDAGTYAPPVFSCCWLDNIRPVKSSATTVFLTQHDAFIHNC